MTEVRRSVLVLHGQRTPAVFENRHTQLREVDLELGVRSGPAGQHMKGDDQQGEQRPRVEAARATQADSIAHCGSLSGPRDTGVLARLAGSTAEEPGR